MNSETNSNPNEVLEILSDKQIFWTLKTIIDNDCYTTEFLDTPVLETFLSLLLFYNLVWITSDDRVLLTDYGSKLFHEITLSNVDLEKKTSKVKKKLIWKPKTKN
jgi:hypothetical protein